MIDLNKIQTMIDEWDLVFVFPNKLSEDILVKLREYNKFRLLGIKNGTYETEHKYQSVDYIVTDYYLCCLYDKKISYPNFFKLIRCVIVFCPSLFFLGEFSDRLSFFKVSKCNFYCNYFRLLYKSLTDGVAIWAMADYLINVFEDKREWSDGRFYFNLLTEENQKFIHEMSQYMD